jgi:pimeloyl-ACP methyl ester carboxylesterase
VHTEVESIYCLSGLGADQRIFKDLQVAGYDMRHLEWLVPKAKGELLKEYALRIAENIKDEYPVLLGVSFGGMMAIEIAKYIPVKAVILISSIKNSDELPRWMRLCGKCKADYLLPAIPLKSLGPLKAVRPIQNYFLGAHSPEAMAIANEFRDNVDPFYLKWSIRQILNWKNKWNPERIYHLHGGNDKLFPLKKVKATHVINDGGHFMIMSHSSEINNILSGIGCELREIRKPVSGHLQQTP